MNGNYAILKNSVLIKNDVILQYLAVIGKNGSKKVKHRCARAINPEPMKKKGI
jgi:hypothetical protein